MTSLFTLDPNDKVLYSKVTLNSGRQMPIVGFGTYRIKGADTIYKVIECALKAGYRCIDTATVYRNERDIGNALKTLLPKYNLKREDIFLVSKLAPEDQGSTRVFEAVLSSLNNLGVSYLDLYLIHWPGANNLPTESKENRKLRHESWDGMVDLHKAGKLKTIGVSNFTYRHLCELLAHSNIQPAVNQVEFHPHYRYPEELITLCNDKKIQLVAYSSLGGQSETETAHLLTDPAVKEVSEKAEKTPSQVLLRWALQTGFAIIPKSENPERIIENAQLDFTLSEENMNKINKIQYRQKYCWNPDIVV